MAPSLEGFRKFVRQLTGKDIPEHRLSVALDKALSRMAPPRRALAVHVNGNGVAKSTDAEGHEHKPPGPGGGQFTGHGGSGGKKPRGKPANKPAEHTSKPADASAILPDVQSAIRQRRDAGRGDVPTNELYAKLSEKWPGLSVDEFKNLLLDLHDRREITIGNAPRHAIPSEFMIEVGSMTTGGYVRFPAGKSAGAPRGLSWDSKNVTDSEGHEHDSASGRFVGHGGAGGGGGRAAAAVRDVLPKLGLEGSHALERPEAEAFHEPRRLELENTVGDVVSRAGMVLTFADDEDDGPTTTFWDAGGAGATHDLELYADASWGGEGEAYVLDGQRRRRVTPDMPAEQVEYNAYLALGRKPPRELRERYGPKRE